MICGGRDVMNCEEPGTGTAEDSQMPTSPFCDVARAEADPVASTNMPSGFKSPTKRDDCGLEALSDGGFPGRLTGRGDDGCGSS